MILHHFTEEPSYQNVALLEADVTCTSSSELSMDHTCYHALKGHSNTYGFASKSEGLAFWLNITLAKTYTLTHARLMPRFNLFEGMKAAQILYESGIADQVSFMLYFFCLTLTILTL
jgi:hypothetical protein